MAWATPHAATADTSSCTVRTVSTDQPATNRGTSSAPTTRAATTDQAWAAGSVSTAITARYAVPARTACPAAGAAIANNAAIAAMTNQRTGDGITFPSRRRRW